MKLTFTRSSRANLAIRLVFSGGLLLAGLAFCLASSACMIGCVTVRPEQRSILADPIMRFEGDPQVKGQVQHALDNREGSTGGSGVQGGGCGCN